MEVKEIRGRLNIARAIVGQVVQASKAPTLTARERIARLLDSGRTFQETRRAMRRSGVSLQYTGHDRPSGSAQVRRLRQMQAGKIPTPCQGCRAGTATSFETKLCVDCLTNKYMS